MVVPAIGERKFEPLFDIAGGPGAAATGSVALYEGPLWRYRLGRDIVLVDQRGTGGSNPLKCRRTDNPLAVMPITAEEAVRCAAELGARSDLTAYTTANAVSDLDEVRRALGYSRISLLGLSYGGRFVLAYVRAHPEIVAHAVLLSPATLDLRIPAFYARDAQRALDQILEDCAREEACSGAFPDPRKELTSVLDRLAGAPAEIAIGTRRVTITRDGFGETLRQLLYSTALNRLVPVAIRMAYRGKWLPIFLAAQGESADLATGMYLSVTCAEDLPFIDLAKAAREAAPTFLGSGRLLAHAELCAHWPHASVPASFAEPVHAETPTLILTGGRDPVTPPSWSESIARTLPNAQLVVIPEMAHFPSPEGIAHIECLDELIVSFLEDRSVDRGCIESMKAAPFAL